MSRKWTRVQSQILAWCGDEKLEITYDGTLIAVPPINEVARVGIRSPYRLPSATTKAGVPLPGTVLVEDVIVQTETGGWKKVFDVSDLCAFLERDVPELFERGFQIVSDPDDVRTIQAEGRPLYEAQQDARARDILGTELARRKRYEDSGQPAPPGSNEADVIWAIRHQQARAARKKSGLDVSTKDLYDAMAGTYSGEPVVGGLDDSHPTPPDAVPTPMTNVSASSMIDAAEEVGVNLTKADLQGLIRGDREIFDYIAEKIKMKRGESVPAV